MQYPLLYQEKETTKQQEAIAENAWKLLDDWRTLPGTQPDGKFSVDNFNNWLSSVKTKCKESGHLDVALSTIGKALIYYTPDPNGFWMHEAFVEALNAEDTDKMQHGFSLGIYNSRGVHCIDPTDQPEKKICYQI